MSGARIATERDAPAIASISRPYVLETAISFEEEPAEAKEIARRISATFEIYPYPVFDDGCQILGYAYGGPHRAEPAYRWSVETTIYVDQDAQRQGIGRTLYSHLLALLAGQGFHLAFAGIVLSNQGSISLHKALGFEYIDPYPEIGFMHGRLHDLGWWGRRPWAIPSVRGRGCAGAVPSASPDYRTDRQEAGGPP